MIEPILCLPARWRRGPQELPATGILLPLTSGVYILLSAALERPPGICPILAFWQMLIEDLVLLAVFGAAA